MLVNSIFFLFIVLALLLGQALAATAGAATEKESPNISTNISFKPNPDKPAPYKTGQGGSRGERCTPQLENPNHDPHLKALIPTKYQGEKTESVELTRSQHPTFWIYLPDTSAKQMVLSIMEVEENKSLRPHAQVFLPVPQKSGIMGLTLPQDSPSLEIGKTYLWAVVLVCGEKPSPNDPTISAWVRRIDLPTSEEGKTALERAKWYGERGIWYDTLSSLAEARRAQPENRNLADIWVSLLASVGLESMAKQPLQF